ncbi:MAG: primosomal protein N' [Acidobacteria bacterium]|nr:primosomal protein N' [Acidobacteriota bacterium]
MSRLVAIAIPVPSLGPLTYRIPQGFDVPRRGTRVLVPLGTRVMTGIVLDSHDVAPVRDRAPESGETVKDVIDVLDEEPFLPGDVLDLALWTADYYLCAPGEAIAAAMPPFAWIESERRISITPAGSERANLGEPGGIRGAILEVLRRRESLSASGVANAVATPQQKRRGGVAVVPRLHWAIRSLEDAGWISVERSLKGTTAAFKTCRIARLTAGGHEMTAPDGNDESGAEVGGAAEDHENRLRNRASRRLTPRQRGALDILRGAPEGVPLSALAEQGYSPDTVDRLAARGLVLIERAKVERDPFGASGAAWRLNSSASNRGSLVLTTEQQAALKRLILALARRTFHVALLHGVTGSGKTELYLRLAQAARARGDAVLVLVPEIALTPAVVTVFRDAFGEDVAVQHSGLSDGERHDQWQRVRRGEVHIVIGTRSAVFAPLGSLGLVIVDEEHDASYKQEENPRYHGRDVAVMRAKAAGALVVLGSATPSLESYQNALRGRYELTVLERRVLDRPLPSVQIVNMREEYAAAGPDLVLSRALEAALGQQLERGEQALVLLNRRGFATSVFCRQCGGTSECPNCSVSLVVHRAARRATCHYCNYSTSIPRTCPVCAGPYLEQIGFGTERVQAELEARFPGARVSRLDRDVIRRRGAAIALLRRFAAREVDVLVGTQMIAKGHDFPGVTLVGVISADVGLGLADFRAAERTFQLLTQVIGRAGRGELPGGAIVQTLYPEHYGIRHAYHQDYRAFFEEEMRFRAAMRYPPLVALVNAIVRNRTPGDALHSANQLVHALRAEKSSFRVLGPAPAPLPRLRGEYRAQLFVKGTRRAAMRSALRQALADERELARRVTIDVDPLSVL